MEQERSNMHKGTLFHEIFKKLQKNNKIMKKIKIMKNLLIKKQKYLPTKGKGQG